MAVRKRKDTGSWITDFYYNGQRIVRTLKFARTRKEAESAESVIMSQVFQQTYGFDTPEDTLLEDFITSTFLPYSEANKKSFRCDVLICKVLVKYFKKNGLTEITSGTIERFKQDFLNTPTKHKKKRSGATVNYHLRVLSKILSMAVDADLIENNPARKVKVLPVNNQRIRVLSQAEETRLTKELEGSVVQKLLIVALHTGLRRQELFNLEWKDIDFDRGVLIVMESKAGKKRIVPMNATVRTLIGNINRTNDLVFPSAVTGEKIVDIKTILRRAMRDAGIADLHFHDLRHTAATRMAMNGADAFSLCAIFGWTDIRMALRYTHATTDAMRAAVENIVANPLPQQRTTVSANTSQELPKSNEYGALDDNILSL